jgi:exopolyphosphatase / guanosine-5'-triphosphate,3'-diphosphate pyrophosphatase
MSIKAAIDIGSSSVKLLVLDVAGDGGYSILAEDSRVTGLGTGVADSGRLGREGMDATLQCLRGMLEQAQRLHAMSMRAAGTDALRRASNRQDFLQLVSAELGLQVEVLTGTEEARLSRAVALREMPDSTGDIVFFDVGGGSTELTWCAQGAVRDEASLGLGARRCSELAGATQPVSAEAQQSLVRLIDAALHNGAPQHGTATVQLAGLGGTASQLVWALRGWRGEPRGEAHGAVVQAADLRDALARLAPMQLAEVQQLAYMDPKRAGIMYGGGAIIDGLLRFYHADCFTVVDRGLRYGLILG